MPPGDPELRPDQEVATGGVRKGALLAGVIFVVVLADYLSKEWIVANIPMYSRRSVIGDFLRLTYTHNPGAAFGMNIGEHSRLFFLVLALVALVVLFLIYRATPRQDGLRLFAVALCPDAAAFSSAVSLCGTHRAFAAGLVHRMRTIRRLCTY